MVRKERLDDLTRRWQERHETRRRAAADAGLDRPDADPERVARATQAFPFRDISPREYVERHGRDMAAFTYDDYVYSDADLQAWIDEVGRLLRARSGSDR